MKSPNNNLLYQIALTQIAGIGDVTARNLLQVFGEAENIFKASRKDLHAVGGIAHKLADEILKPVVLIRAEEELNFVQRNNIQTFFINETNYPHRLREYPDAPILLYFKGNTDINPKRVISIVGTRNSSNYGNQFCDTFLKEIAETIPDTLIISGLAYGIDICAHRSALKYGLPTIGVLAHGLDRIYPQVHRQTAAEMINNGGIISDFPSKTEPDKFNFVRRNRIVAGMADAVIVVESGEKGGSLITADIANSYCKDVFAVPGKTTDTHSIGCNKLIANHKADLLLSTQYFLYQMGWNNDSDTKAIKPLQQELIFGLNETEQKVIDILKQNNDSTHIDVLGKEAGIAVYQLSAILLELEMKGIITNVPGNSYKIN